MARLAYADPSDVTQVMRPFPPPLRNMNFGRMLSHAPTLAAPYYNTYAAALSGLELHPKLRQLAILRVAERASASYVLAQHRPLARIAGLTDQQITAAGQPSFDSGCYWSESSCFTYVQRHVLAFTDAVIAGPRISDGLFERIRGVLTPREIVELLLVIGWYWTACRLTTILEIEPEHALGHGLLAMLEFEKAKQSGQLVTAAGSADLDPVHF
ncbi:MAG: carboxymuconolactone decarboxylase family protein [Solirubrobacterales bacterium]|nr:carboxymuconolactone decarboxylase family protein [Solirubrobacterales bacterium]